MKKIIKIVASIILATVSSQSIAQTSVAICNGDNTVLTATNTVGLSNPTYSLNPGGVSSSNPTFAVSPTITTTYTLYVTGTNSNSAVVTNINTVTVQVNGVSFSLSSPQNYTLGCGSNSGAVINVINAITQPVPGGPVSYTFLAPGNYTVPPTGTLSSITSVTINAPGSWTVGVRDNTSFCTGWETFTVTQTSGTPPGIGNISVSQNPLSCNNPSTIVQVSPTQGLQYNWTPISSNSYSAVVQTVVQTTPSIPTQSIAATLTLQVIDLTSTCQSDTVITIFQNIYKPNASISGPPSPALCTNSIVLTNVSTTGIPTGTFPITAPVAAIQWEGPAPQPTLGISSTYIAQTTGIYTMTAMDGNNGCISTATYAAYVKPVAAFAHTVSNGQVTFSNTTLNVAPPNTTFSSTTYFWDFGDGNTSTLQNPVHNYSNSGAHIVKFKVSHPGTLCVDSVMQAVTVTGIPCLANSGFSFVPTSTAQVWNAIPFYPWNVTAASWSWGDGSSSNTLYTSHQYSAAGMYNICLSVTVSCVASSSTCTSYSVFRPTPAAQIIEVNVLAPELISGLFETAQNASFEWNIIPNPNNGDFKVRLENAQSEVVHVEICDVTGRVVYNETIEADSATIGINTNNLLSGVYFVSLETNNQKTTKRMVVHR